MVAAYGPVSSGNSSSVKPRVQPVPRHGGLGDLMRLTRETPWELPGNIRGGRHT